MEPSGRRRVDLRSDRDWISPRAPLKGDNTAPCELQVELPTTPLRHPLFFTRTSFPRAGAGEVSLSPAPPASVGQNTVTLRWGRPGDSLRQDLGAWLFRRVRHPSTSCARSGPLSAPQVGLDFQERGARAGAPRGSSKGRFVFAGLWLASASGDALAPRWSLSKGASGACTACTTFSRPHSTRRGHGCSLPPADSWLCGGLAMRTSRQVSFFARASFPGSGAGEVPLSSAPPSSSCQNTVTSRWGRPGDPLRQGLGRWLFRAVRRPSTSTARSAPLSPRQVGLGFWENGQPGPRAGAPRGSSKGRTVFAKIWPASASGDALSTRWSLSKWASGACTTFSGHSSTRLAHGCSSPLPDSEFPQSLERNRPVANKRLLLTDLACCVGRGAPHLLRQPAAEPHVRGAEMSYLEFPLSE